MFRANYIGSDDYDVGGMPFIGLGWKSTPVVPAGGTGLQLGMHDITLNIPRGVEIGIAKFYRPEGLYRAHIGLSYNKGRDQDDNTVLNGMGDIDGHGIGTLGINFKAKESGLLYGLKFTQDLSNETDGSIVDGKLGFAFPLGKELMLSTFATASWADDDYMQSYFGVSQSQSVTSSNAQFNAGSGFQSVGLSAELGWKINENWMLKNDLSYVRLTNDVADSPLVKDQGTANQFKVMIALAYDF